MRSHGIFLHFHIAFTGFWRRNPRLILGMQATTLVVRRIAKLQAHGCKPAAAAGLQGRPTIQQPLLSERGPGIAESGPRGQKWACWLPEWSPRRAQRVRPIRVKRYHALTRSLSPFSHRFYWFCQWRSAAKENPLRLILGMQAATWVV
jgi:hypothetical protein